MDSFVSLFQWFLQVTPVLSVQLLLILLFVKPVHQWFGSHFAYRLWLLPFLWFPLSMALSSVISIFAEIIGAGSVSVIPATSTLITNLNHSETQIFEDRIFRGAAGNQALDLWLIATSVWLGVIALLIITQIARAVSLRMHLRKENCHALSAEVRSIVALAGFPEGVPTKVVSNLNSPALYGIVHRTLLIPEDFEKQLDSDQMLMILRHEYAHYCRNDNLINCAFLLCVILFWFNPVVWIAFKRFRVDQELACDSTALRGCSQKQRSRFAEAFLCSFRGKQFPSNAELSGWGDSNGVKERASMLGKHHRQAPKGSKKILVLGLMIVVGATSSSYLRSQVNVREEQGMLQAETIPDEILEEFDQYDQSTEAALGLENRSAEQVPADSEYIAFVLDTSGSMANTPGSWAAAQDQIFRILNLYSDLSGFQIMNDMGSYLIAEYRNEWIPPTTERIESINDALLYWRPYSNSSPVEGVAEVLNNLATSYANVSVYIIGDDLQPEVLPTTVLENINQYNQPISSAGYIARIHAIMLPNILMGPERYRDGAYNFANLMRAVAGSNGGSFTLIKY